MKKKAHFIGICGVGMGALANLLKRMDYSVTGSDENIYPPMSLYLKEKNIPFFVPHSPENIPSDTDLIVVGKHIALDNPEYIEAKNKNYKIYSFPELLGKMTTEYLVVAVAGTYGKTTITAILSWILEVAGYEPGFMIGGFPQNFNESSRFPGTSVGKIFVVESDEYPSANFDLSSKFLHYHPQMAIITSAEWDHVNVFLTEESYVDTFTKFVRLLPSEGIAIMGMNNPNIDKILHIPCCRVETYSEHSSSADWQFLWRGMTTESSGASFSHFEVLRNKKKWALFKTSLAGKYNAENAVAAIAIAYSLEVPLDKISCALETFKGLKRRQEVKEEINNIVLIDDLAHHPAKVRAALSGLREKYPKRKIWAIFEPHTYSSRMKSFAVKYHDAFNNADEVIIAKIPLSENIPEAERISSVELANIISESRKKRGISSFIRSIEDLDDLSSEIALKAEPGDILFFMSSGGFGGIMEKTSRKLKARFKQP